MNEDDIEFEVSDSDYEDFGDFIEECCETIEDIR